VAVDRLRLFEENKGGDPAAVSVSFQLNQPGKLPAAHFGTVARLGPVGRGVPPQRTGSHDRPQAENTGSVASTGHAHRLGGDGLDSGMALALNDGRISLDALALTDRNVRYDTIHVRGPLNAPKIEIAPVLSGVFRVTDWCAQHRQERPGCGHQHRGGWCQCR
jgi:hypothetical protein